ncbi:MAG: peptidylprolyl isomerase [Acidiferrobacteraceae bacterium]
MTGRHILALSLAVCCLAVAPCAFATPRPNPRVELRTTLGAIEIELYPEKAPVTVHNFLRYVRTGFYDGTIFHRVIRGFMIQGGGFTRALREKPARAPIRNEADNGLKNRVGTISMARTSDPDSATAQFFINTADNRFLNFRSKTSAGWGYAVFGRVIHGMRVVRRIEAVPTETLGPFQNLPVHPVVIEKAFIVGTPGTARRSGKKPGASPPPLRAPR